MLTLDENCRRGDARARLRKSNIVARHHRLSTIVSFAFPVVLKHAYLERTRALSVSKPPRIESAVSQLSPARVKCSVCSIRGNKTGDSLNRRLGKGGRLSDDSQSCTSVDSAADTTHTRSESTENECGFSQLRARKMQKIVVTKSYFTTPDRTSVHVTVRP